MVETIVSQVLRRAPVLLESLPPRALWRDSVSTLQRITSVLILLDVKFLPRGSSSNWGPDLEVGSSGGDMEAGAARVGTVTFNGGTFILGGCWRSGSDSLAVSVALLSVSDQQLVMVRSSDVELPSAVVQERGVRGASLCGDSWTVSLSCRPPSAC